MFNLGRVNYFIILTPSPISRVPYTAHAHLVDVVAVVRNQWAEIGQPLMPDRLPYWHRPGG